MIISNCRPSREVRRQGGCTLAGLAMWGVPALCVLLVFGHHVWFWFVVAYEGLGGYHAVPARELPAADVPEDWIRHRVGSVSISLPPDFTSIANTTEDENWYDFRDGKKHVSGYVKGPTDPEFEDLIWQTRSVDSHLQRMTWPQVRLASLQTDIDEFSWTMSSQDLQWLLYRLRTRDYIRAVPTEYVEYLFTEKIDLLLLQGEKRYKVDIERKDVPYQVVFNFRALDEDPLDWARRFCQSIKADDAAE